jgi:hypothetical protein
MARIVLCSGMKRRSDGANLSDVFRTQKKITAFLNIAPSSLVEADRRFRGACCLHHQSDRGVIPQKAVIVTYTHVFTLPSIDCYAYADDTYRHAWRRSMCAMLQLFMSAESIQNANTCGNCMCSGTHYTFAVLFRASND